MKDIKMSLKVSFPGLTGESRSSGFPACRQAGRFRGNGKEKMLKAQASIEATLSLICLALLLMGGLRIFLWSARHAVERQKKYESDRVRVTGTREILLPNDLPKLDIFAENGIKQ